MKLSLLTFSVFALLAFSVAADAKRCAKGKGYRYINGQKVCPEEMIQSRPSSRPLTYDEGENDAWLGAPLSLIADLTMKGTKMRKTVRSIAEEIIGSTETGVTLRKSANKQISADPKLRRALVANRTLFWAQFWAGYLKRWLI